MRVKLLAGNWKMNKTSADLEPFFAGLGGGFPADRVEVMIAAPFTLLATARELAEPRGIRVAAQNVHWESSGAFTGEVSLPMLKDIGVSATLIGHSERRQYFAETDQTVSKKVRAALAAGVTPVVCVGETLEERERNETDRVVRRQVLAALEGLDAPRDLVIAYEPVWAIGTGRTATNAQAQEVHAHIRKIVDERFGAAAAESMRILYGGSANPGNIQGLLAERDIDGALVGGASLKAADFGAMVKAAL
jgi:triosephosphate isomerase